MLNTKGFTLIELLVTVIIVGILAAMAMPSYYRFLERARTADVVNTMGTAVNAQERYYVKRDQYSQHWSHLDAVPETIRTPGVDNGYSSADNKTYFTKGGGEAAPNNGFAVTFDLTKNSKFIVAQRVGSNKYTYTIVRPFDEKRFYCLPDTANEEDVRLCLDFMGVDSVDLLPADPRAGARAMGSWF